MVSTKRKTQSEEPDRFAVADEALNAAHVARVVTGNALEAAEQHLGELRWRLEGSGDVTVTPQALAEARATIEWAELRVSFADRHLAQTKRGMPVRPDLAEAIAEAVGDVLKVPVEVVETLPDEIPEALPIAYLIQSQANERDVVGGYLSGAVVLHYVRSPLHADLDADKLERALHGKAIGLAVQDRATTKLGNGAEDQVLRLDIARATEAIPLILGERPLGWRVKGTANGLAAAIERNSVLGGRTSVQAKGTESLRSVRLDGDLRHSVIELDLSARANAGQWEPGQVGERIRNEVAGWLGKALDGIGRVAVAEVERLGPDGGGWMGARVRLELLSRMA